MRTFPPLKPDHPAVGRDCGLCKVPFVAGDATVLLPLEQPGQGVATVAAALVHAWHVSGDRAGLC